MDGLGESGSAVLTQHTGDRIPLQNGVAGLLAFHYGISHVLVFLRGRSSSSAGFWLAERLITAEWLGRWRIKGDKVELLPG